MRVLELVEHRWTRFPSSAISEAEATHILRFARRPIKIDWPNPANGLTWGLFPEGWVGTLAAADGLRLLVKPKTSLRGLSTWIAWSSQEFDSSATPASEVGEEATLAQHLISQLLQLVETRLLIGVHREYSRKAAWGLSAKGRLLLRESLLRLASGGVGLAFEQTVLSADVDENRLVYWALHRIAMLHLLEPTETHKLHWLLGFMSSAVRLTPFETSEYKGRVYSSRAADYSRIHELCAQILEGLGPEASSGDNQFGEFTISMWNLFQQAVGVSLKRGLDGVAHVDTTFSMRLGGSFTFRPDVVVTPKNGRRPLVVEVKYKDPAGGISEHDLRQAVAYAAALGARRTVLVYPQAGLPRQGMRAGPIHVDFAMLDISLAPEAAAAALVAELRSEMALPA